MGARFENLIAVHLMKWCLYLQDTEGRDIEVRYFRDIDKREVDFVIIEKGKPIHFIECKTSDKSPAPSLRYLKKRFPAVKATQIILETDIDLTTKENIRLCSAHGFLSYLI